MSAFGTFSLDREGDLRVDLSLEDGSMRYVISTPNHHTGNLITNLARLCALETSEDEKGLRVIRGEIPCYCDGSNRRLYILRHHKENGIPRFHKISCQRNSLIVLRQLFENHFAYSLDAFSVFSTHA